MRLRRCSVPRGAVVEHMSNIYEGKQLPSGWFVYTTDDGRPYFHNRFTASTQWDVPNASATGVESHGTTPTTEIEFLISRGGGDGEITLSGSTTVDSSHQGRMLHLGDDVLSLADRQALGTSSSKAGTSYTGFGPPEKSFSPFSGQIDVEASHSTLSNLNSNSQQSSPLKCFCLDLSTAQPLFDVDTPTVVTRVGNAVIPYKLLAAYRNSADVSYASPSAPSSDIQPKNIIDSLRQSPDFYGPVWIPTTLIFMLFVATNAPRFFANQNLGTNYRTLIVSAFTVYGYLIIVPLAAWIILLTSAGSREKTAISLIQLASVYGYSFATAIPLAALSVIPLSPLRWAFALLGSALSFFFIMLHFKGDLRESLPQLKLSILACFLLAQLTFYASFPLYYFTG